MGSGEHQQHWLLADEGRGDAGGVESPAAFYAEDESESSSRGIAHGQPRFAPPDVNIRALRYFVVLLVAAAALVYGVGCSLPVSHVSSRAERFDAPMDSVWRAITDVAAYPSWRTDITSVELLPSVDGHPAWREVAGREPVEYVGDEVVAPERFTARITTKGLPYGGRWRYELFGDGGATRLTITEEGEVYNPIFRFLTKYVLGETATIEKVLTALHTRVASRG